MDYLLPYWMVFEYHLVRGCLDGDGARDEDGFLPRDDCLRRPTPPPRRVGTCTYIKNTKQIIKKNVTFTYILCVFVIKI